MRCVIVIYIEVGGSKPLFLIEAPHTVKAGENPNACMSGYALSQSTVPHACKVVLSLSQSTLIILVIKYIVIII